MAALWRTLQERGFCSSISSNCSSSSSPFEADGVQPAGITMDGMQTRRGSGGGDGSAMAVTLEQRQGRDTSVNCGSSTIGGHSTHSGRDNDRRKGGHVEGGGDRTKATTAPGEKTIDVVLHSVAHAPTGAMRQGFIEVR